MVYLWNTTGCPATCQDPDAPLHCPLANKDDCICKPGLVLRRGECVTPDQCKCTDGEGNTFEIGSSWLSPDCTKSYQCDSCTQCSLPVGIITEKEHKCPGDTICLTGNSNISGVCEPVLQCPLDMEFLVDTSACVATCLDPDAPRLCTKPRTKGCRCKPGLILRDLLSEQCIKPRECHCLHGRHKFKMQSSWLSEDCSRRYSCKPCTECVLPVAKTVISGHKCQDGYSYHRDDKGLGQCLPDPTCPPPMVYSKMATSCPATCSDPDAPWKCLKAPHPGCTCPDRMVYQDNKCIDPKKCKCVDKFGSLFKLGESWLSSDCTVHYTCDSCNSCRLPVSVINTQRHQCQSSHRCVSFDNKYGSCKQVQPCPRDMTYSFRKSGCSATCQDPEAPHHCSLPAMEGCECEQGLLLKGNCCVPPSQCGCLDQKNREFQIGRFWLSSDCKKQYECKLCKTCKTAIAVIKETPFSCHSNEICDSDSQGVGICIQKNPETTSTMPEGLPFTNEIDYLPEVAANNPTLTLNGLVIEPNDIVDVQPNLNYTLGITLPHSSSTLKILMRKVVGYTITQHEECFGSRTCRDVYEFEKGHQWQRVRLEIELLDGETSTELIIVCNIKDPTEDENWKIAARSISALSTSSSNMFTIKINQSILVCLLLFLVSIMLL